MQKICFIGKNGSGKTAYVRHLLGVQEEPYMATLGCDVHPIGNKTVWDMGYGKFGGLCEGYMIGSRLALSFPREGNYAKDYEKMARQHDIRVICMPPNVGYEEWDRIFNGL